MWSGYAAPIISKYLTRRLSPSCSNWVLHALSNVGIRPSCTKNPKINTQKFVNRRLQAPGFESMSKQIYKCWGLVCGTKYFWRSSGGTDMIWIAHGSVSWLHSAIPWSCFCWLDQANSSTTERLHRLLWWLIVETCRNAITISDCYREIYSLLPPA